MWSKYTNKNSLSRRSIYPGLDNDYLNEEREDWEDSPESTQILMISNEHDEKYYFTNELR